MSHIKRGASIVVPDSLSVDARMPLEAARRQIRLSSALIFGNYSGSLGWRKDGMTAQHGLQRGEQIHALLASRRQLAADATSRSSSSSSSGVMPVLYISLHSLARL